MSESSYDLPQNLTQIVDRLQQTLQEEDEANIEVVFEALDGRVFGPILAFLGLLVVIPVGAIPGVPAVIGVTAFLISVQKVFGKKYPWIPRKIREKSVEREKLNQSLDKLKPWFKWVDKLLKPRLKFLIEGKMQYVIAIAVVLLAVAMPPLGLIPFAAMIPAAGIFFFGLSITANDGLLALVGLTIFVGLTVFLISLMLG